MQKPLGDFIYALREHGLPVSPAESLDAMQAVRLIGIEHPLQLRSALGMTLAKTQEHLILLETLFQQFFQLNDHTQLTSQIETADQTNLAETQESNEPQAQAQAQAQESQPSDVATDPQSNDSAGSAVASPLGQQLMDNEQAALSVAIAAAGAQSGAQTMQAVTQQSQVTYRIMRKLGNEALNQELLALSEDPEQNTRFIELKRRQQQLQQQTREYVEQQYLLFTLPKGKQLRTQNLQRVKLTNVDHHYQAQMGQLIQQAAKKLASLHSRRRKVSKRGLLDVRRTIAANAAFDGLLFHTKWKATRIERPKVLVLCDVSGSVSRVARFLLLFLHSLQDVLPKVRSFVFASDMGEVTELFERLTVEEALAEIMDRWANRPTDYGCALEDFKRLALNDIDPKTTVIMLGDARNNQSDGRSDIWQQVYQRSQRVLWLNPEGRFSWDSGDSIISEYAPYCSNVEPCNSLNDINRILNNLLKHG